MTKRKEIGNIGEKIAQSFLRQKGYSILDTNYLKKWGELDIVCKKDDILHIVEVKTISRENILYAQRNSFELYRPEENMHPHKIQRIHRALQSYIAEKNYVGEWIIDLVAVELFIQDKKAKCTLIKDIF